MRTIVGLMVVAVLFTCSGCVRPLRIDGPYEGRVIDAESSQPIEGVVVDATWHRIYPNVAGSSSAYYDTSETVTDKNGYFSIPGQGLLILSTIDKADITIFKAGYDGVGPGPWTAFDNENIWQFKGKITREGSKLLFKLKRLSMEERINRTGIFPFPNSHNIKATRLFRLENNKEMIEIGRSEKTLLPVE